MLHAPRRLKPPTKDIGTKMYEKGTSYGMPSAFYKETDPATHHNLRGCSQLLTCQELAMCMCVSPPSPARASSACIFASFKRTTCSSFLTFSCSTCGGIAAHAHIGAAAHVVQPDPSVAQGACMLPHYPTCKVGL